MSGEALRVMIVFGLSIVTSVASGSGASSRVQPSSKSSRRSVSKRPVTLVAEPRPRRRSAGEQAFGDRNRIVARFAAGWAEMDLGHEQVP